MFFDIKTVFTLNWIITCNCLNSLKWKCFWQLNCVLMLNWTVFNRTDYLHKNGFGVKAIKPNKPNQTKHFFIKIYPTHFILARVDVGCVWEVSWRRGQTATYSPQVLLTIAALLSYSGWAAQPWVPEGPKPSVCHWLSRWYLVPNGLQLQLELTQAVCGTWLYNCLTPICFHCYLHRCISWLSVGSRVNIQH